VPTTSLEAAASASVKPVSAVLGKRPAPLQIHAIEWDQDWVTVIGALHHAIHKVEYRSLYSI